MNIKSTHGSKLLRNNQAKDTQFLELIPKKFILGLVLVKAKIDNVEVAAFVCRRSQFRSKDFLIKAGKSIVRTLGLNKIVVGCQ